MTADTIAAKVRRRLADYPRFVFQSGAVNNTTNPIDVTLGSGQGTLFPAPGGLIAWDDGTQETGIVASVAGDVITVNRAPTNEDLVAHSDGARILLSPRFTPAVLNQLVTDIVNELWPTIWVPMETTLAYQAANEYFSPTVNDVAELAYVYQLYGGFRWPLHAAFLSPDLADNTNFPNGAITIPFGSTVDLSTIYVAYKAIPTTTNLLARQETIVVDGVIAKATLDEEARHVAPTASSIERRVADGAKLRAGMMLWQQYQIALQTERVRLLAEEVPGARVWGG